MAIAKSEEDYVVSDTAGASPMTKDTFSLLLQLEKNQPWRVLFYVLFATGARSVDIAQMKGTGIALGKRHKESNGGVATEG
jgi:hypothetical protein